MIKSKIKFYVLLMLIQLGTGPAKADEILVAVASNFKNAITKIARDFESESNHKITLIIGSTGKHYAQIKNGAPFDAFFAADSKRPELLEKEGQSVAGSRFTYALGKLVLWSPRQNFVDAQGDVLEKETFEHLAMAHPELAPYGKSAYEVLQARGLWDSLKSKVVRGENIGQAFHFVKSGNAELGFVAYSQIIQPGQLIAGSYWDIPQSLYSAIEQQAVLLKDNQATRDFLERIKTDKSREIISHYGYGTMP